ncbi:hypothetical protein HK101_005201, partial [Irineochytrium annulatum]
FVGEQKWETHEAGLHKGGMGEERSERVKGLARVADEEVIAEAERALEEIARTKTLSAPLPTSNLTDLCLDVASELERRWPDVKEAGLGTFKPVAINAKKGTKESDGLEFGDVGGGGAVAAGGSVNGGLGGIGGHGSGGGSGIGI